jgi:alkanesulfonate monooxygenase SsuD/methylene tetrahydromethanopterin reductase-like flavin-dependent oxidoreductase (luciferase family)
MRLGLALSTGASADPLARLAEQAAAAEDAGIEIVWLEPDAVPVPLLTAAALAARTSSVRIAACVPAGPHPLAIAEAASVADNCSAGRLILAIADCGGDAELLAETADALLPATAARPFAHAGRRWRIPAALPENDGRAERIVVTPSTVQIELPLWLCGASAAGVARERGLCSVSGEHQSAAQAAAAWSVTAQALGLAAARLRRPALRALAADERGVFDDEQLVARLRAEQRDWGLDVAILSPPSDLGEAAWRALIDRIASRVRPRVIQEELPDGLEQHWRERSSQRSDAI